jgi:transcription initiation factor TFIID subunit 2
MKCILTSAITSDPRPFLTYTREGNYVPLRLVAFDCVMLCKPPGRSQPLTRYIFDVIQHDHSLVVRRHVARAVSESFLVTLALGDIPGLLPPPAIVDDRVDLEKKQEQDGQALVKGMRKDASKRTDLKEMLQSGLL